jgi:DNA-binding response OmpR family regulator
MKTAGAIDVRRILIVDSDPIMRELEADGLKTAGYTTVCSQDANDAARVLADDHRFDLIIVDLMVPTKTDGLSFVRRLRHESNRTTPIMVHTADTDAADEARQAGASRIVVKPVAWKCFVREIRELLDS